MKQRAFTLIELLVVIAIMMILAAILFPVLAGAKRKAAQIQCVAQLHQLGLAIQMYAADNDGLAPMGAYLLAPLPPTANPTRNPPTPAALRPQWQDLLLIAGGIRSPAIFICPLAADTRSPYAYHASYGANRWVMGWQTAANMDTIPDPTRTVLVAEKTGHDWVAFPPSDQPNNPYYFPLDPRHEGQLNLLYCDGHVHPLSIGSVENPAVIWRW